MDRVLPQVARSCKLRLAICNADVSEALTASQQRLETRG
jgi:hypothetical protein